MPYETAAKRLGNPYGWRHLRPFWKRVANGFIRTMDRKLIAEFDEDDTDIRPPLDWGSFYDLDPITEADEMRWAYYGTIPV